MKLSKCDLELFGFITGWYIKGVDISGEFEISNELQPYILELKGLKRKSEVTLKVIKWCKSNINILTKRTNLCKN